jgi:hypothetical protein
MLWTWKLFAFWIISKIKTTISAVLLEDGPRSRDQRKTPFISGTKAASESIKEPSKSFQKANIRHITPHHM